jgi:anthranilate phosphoribosyltransferase
MNRDAEEKAGPSFTELLVRLVRGEDLGVDGAELAFRAIMEGRVTSVQTAALLVALRTRGEQAAEVAGGVRALRAAMVPVAASDPGALVDTCGTGGGAITTFNISTAAALVAAGAGVRIAKHGNRSFTSRCGSADVLAELGVMIELTPQGMATVLEEAGIVFMFAPLLHPAMKHVSPVRRELGLPTIMNILGPLTNPAGARRQVVGVADPNLVELIAGGLAELGHTHAIVTHGEPGLDEISPVAESDVFELKDGSLRRYRIRPDELLDEPIGSLDEIAGGDPAWNARIVTGVLNGEIRGTARAVVLLNAGAAVYVGGLADSIAEGVQSARTALDEGRAIQALDRLRDSTRRAADA